MVGDIDGARIRAGERDGPCPCCEHVTREARKRGKRPCIDFQRELVPWVFRRSGREKREEVHGSAGSEDRWSDLPLGLRFGRQLVCSKRGLIRGDHDPGAGGRPEAADRSRLEVRAGRPAGRYRDQDARKESSCRRVGRIHRCPCYGWRCRKSASLTAIVQSPDPTAVAATAATGTGRVAGLAGDPFRLAAATVSTPASAILPNEAWFALADVTNDGTGILPAALQHSAPSTARSTRH